MNKIRNFCIIAHIDHGKSTLADRLLELTGVCEKSDKWQVLDSMDLEQERWITIKLAPARMFWHGYQFNLIDTPWHADFQYEVSRSLSSVEWVVLLVDATQWVQAQTLSTLYMAMDYDLEIIPVLNKIDLPSANVEKVSAELENLIGIDTDDIICISAKTWKNVEKILDAVIQKIPAPSTDEVKNTDLSIWKSLIFDSTYDPYKWVVLYVRNFAGQLKAKDFVYLPHTWKQIQIQEVWYFYPKYKSAKTLNEWEIWYVVTWLKSVKDAQIWDTLVQTQEKLKLTKQEDLDKLISYAIWGFKKMQAFVYAWVYPIQTDDYEKLKSSLEKLAINDSAITYDIESSQAFGFGFRCGFLWMLHMDIVKERLSREFDIDTIFTSPNVIYFVKMRYLNYDKIKHWDNIMEFKKTWFWKEIVKIKFWNISDKEIEENYILENSNIVNLKTNEVFDLKPYIIVRSGSDMPDSGYIEEIYEPFVNLEIVGPGDYSGAIMDLAQDARWNLKNMEYIDQDRVLRKYDVPLSEIIVDFYDSLKSITKWYASMNYEPSTYKSEDLVRLDIFINKEIVSAFSTVSHKDKSYNRWKSIVENLKELIPKHMFTIPLQAVVWNKPIAREDISALKKDVLAKCYGGDVSRKRKLLEKQKEWKKKMKAIGRVNIPSDTFIKMLNKH